MQFFYLQIMNVFCLLTDLKISLKRHLYFAFTDISLIFGPFQMKIFHLKFVGPFL